MKRLFSLLLMFVTLSFVGCEGLVPEGMDPSNDDNQNVTPSFTFDDSAKLELEVDCDGGKYTYKFTTNSDWSVESSAKWVTVTPEEGTAEDTKFKVVIEDNTMTKSRKATVTVYFGEDLEEEVEIAITQEGATDEGEDEGSDDGNDDGSDDGNGEEKPVFTIDPKGKVIVEAKGGEVVLDVTTNLEYTVDIPIEAQAWLSVADTRAVREEKLTFTVEENLDENERVATVRLLDSDDKELKNIVFKQKGASADDGTDDGNDDGTQTPPMGDGLVLVADKTAVELGDVVKFTVTLNGKDVTKSSTIYDKDMQKVANAEFLAEVSGSYSFFATNGGASSNYVNISVVASIPELPEDTDVENTKFNHRILVIDHTGVNCRYCPDMVDKLLAFEETEWGAHMNEVTCHAGGMASGDPGGSQAANIVNQFYRPSGYPNININFRSAMVENYGESYFLQLMSKAFESLVKKEGADVSAAVATAGDASAVYASVAVKAAVEQEYKITAWLLENNIYSPNQVGAQKDHHRIYQHALRNIGGTYSSSDLSGDSLGVIAAGQTVTTAFELGVTSKSWNHENMEVLIIISAKDEAQRWEVANTILCPVNSSVNFEYVE